MTVIMMKPSFTSFFVIVVALAGLTLGHTPEPAAAQQVSQPTTATVLLTDISGSMNERDAGGLVKLDAAKQASRVFIDAIAAERQNQVTSRRDYLTQLAFCDNSLEVQGFTTDLAAIRDAINILDTCGSTNMYAGFNLTIQRLSQFRASQPVDQTVVVLLSDGVPTETSSGLQTDDVTTLQDEVVNLMPQLQSQGACLYVIPLGDPNATLTDESFVDRDFLQRLVNVVGCGELLPFAQSGNLVNRYLSVRVASIGGNVVVDQTITVEQNQLVELAPVVVDASIGQFRIDAFWSVNVPIEVEIIDPDGIVVGAGYPSLSTVLQPGQAQIIVSDPKPGSYQTKFRNNGDELTNVNVLISTLPGSGTAAAAAATAVSPTGTTNALLPLAAVVIVGLAGAAITGFLVYSSQQSRPQPVTSTGALIILNGMMSGQTIPITVSPFTIGRNRGCHLQIMQADVSRQHAQIMFQNGIYILQDLNSQSGTRINGFPVHQHMLQNGDNIRIGTLNLRFQQ